MGQRWRRASRTSDPAADGGNPYSSVVLDSAGNIYGTAYHGGAYNNGGVAFEISR